MPFTRPILEYEINKLVVKIGCALEIWIKHLPFTKKEDREAVEKRVIDILGLETAIKDGLIREYKVQWKKGQVKEIWLVPSDRTRRTPGLGRLRQLLLKGEMTRKENVFRR